MLYAFQIKSAQIGGVAIFPLEKFDWYSRMNE